MHNTEHASALVSISRCAELLAQAGDVIDRSALSRYCDQHNLKRERAGRQTLVDFEEVRAHRAASYTREVMSGRAVAPTEPHLATVTPIDPAKRRAAAQAQKEELDLAERLGELTAIAEVDAGAAQAITDLRSAFQSVLHDQSEQLAAELALPPERIRQLRAGLTRFARVGQQRFAAALAGSLAAANEPSSAAHARLIHLAAIAARLRADRHQMQARA